MKEGASCGKGGQPRLQSFCPCIQARGVSPLRFDSQRLPQVTLAKVHFQKVSRQTAPPVPRCPLRSLAHTSILHSLRRAER